MKKLAQSVRQHTKTCKTSMQAQLGDPRISKNHESKGLDSKVD